MPTMQAAPEPDKAQELVDKAVDLEGSQSDAVSPERRAQLVEQVRAGAEEGVFYVRNLGVDSQLLDEMRRLSKAFFALPTEEKQKCKTDAPGKSGQKLGWGCKLSSAVATRVDPFPGFREFFRMQSAPEDEGMQDNVWPDNPAEFRDTFERYQKCMLRAMDWLTGLLLEGLDLPPSYIRDKYGDPLVLGFQVSTPAQELPPGQMPAPGVPAHTDSNLFNINVSAGVRGLQYFVGGDWLTVAALLGDAAVVNIGEDLETISNGKYHAIYHRVLTNSSQPRLSMLTTTKLGSDQEMAPAAQLIGEDNPCRYRARKGADRTAELIACFNGPQPRKPDRSKSHLLFDFHANVDKTRNVYNVGHHEFINGKPLQDWGHILH